MAKTIHRFKVISSFHLKYLFSYSKRPEYIMNKNKNRKIPGNFLKKKKTFLRPSLSIDFKLKKLM